MWLERDPASFRDPSGHVYEADGRIFRTVTEYHREDYEFVRDSGALAEPTRRGWLIGAEELPPDALAATPSEAVYVLEHPRIPLISYPYEWCFDMLRDAALLHLDLQRQLLDHDISLSDASAYNVQFVGPEPVFIDYLSPRRYRHGELWYGHRQFCEQFLNPLLLDASLGIPFNSWLRGSLTGIATLDLNRALPFHRKWSWRVLSHVTLPARLQRSMLEGNKSGFRGDGSGRLPPAGYRGLLTQLRDWIAGLRPKAAAGSTWGDYPETGPYSETEETAKRRFVADFIAQVRPKTLLDLGCNTGEYAEIALAAGAQYVIGCDTDPGALSGAYARAKAQGLNLLPLYLDAANPSPDQGWNQSERKGFRARTTADAILALAFLHHPVIGHNLPLEQVVSWLVESAPFGVIEFVPKSDPMIRKMLAFREDIFRDYDETRFVAALEDQARIIGRKRITATGRCLYSFERNQA